MTATPAERLAHWPAEAPALAWPGGSMNYAMLREHVDSIAAMAAALGARDSPLAVLSSSRVNIVLGMLAALRLGRPALPLDAARTDIAGCLATCAPGGVIDDAAITAAAAAAVPATHLAPPTKPGHESIALLVPTSGTGGRARVAMLSYDALNAHVTASAKVLPALGAGDRWLVCLPMASIGGLAALWRTLTAGACLAVLEHFDAEDARRVMAEKASHVSIVPAMLEPLAASPGPAPRDLRCMLTGGGPLSTQAAQCALEKDWPLWTGWGMTETASHVAVMRVDAGWREGIVGRPLPGVRIEVDDATGRLAIAGPMLMSGYARAGGAAGEAPQPGGRFLSNDLGEFLPDGRLRVSGRADDVIVTGGVKVHPQAVEEALAACPDIGDVAVTARVDDRWGMVLVALYSGEATATSLEAWARQQLPSTSRPRQFQRVVALPRNAMGKLVRRDLPALIDPRWTA
jgi:o-succinylbenzoate---CoA ligase